MAVKEIDYSRMFVSRTDKRIYKTDKSHAFYSGTPACEERQVQSDEDKSIREEMERKYGLKSGTEEFGERTTGFDRQFLYSFWVDTKGLISLGITSPKNIEYPVHVHIKKSGSEEDLDQPSDLEIFLLEKGFCKVEPKQV
jgi:hypothetical protein